jgi:hypothetical protein
MSSIKYILVSTIVLSACLLLYRMIIKHHTDFGARRAALLLILFFAIILPFLQIKLPNDALVSQLVDPSLFFQIDEFYIF